MSEISRNNKKQRSYDPANERPPCKPGENPLDCHFRWSIALYAQHPVPEAFAREVVEKGRQEMLARRGQ